MPSSSAESSSISPPSSGPIQAPLKKNDGLSKSPPPSANSTASSPPSSAKPKTNRLFLIFILLCFIVAMVNIQFHHQFHDEHVIDKTMKDFSARHFQTERNNMPLSDNFHNVKPPPSGEVAGQKQQASVSEAQSAKLAQSGSDEPHKLAGLKCMEKYGGPEDDYAEKEMAFWSDIPSDASYKSPFMEGEEKFLTFEPDHGGWNNIRMAMETALVLAHAMGRTLVLPPEQRFYLLGKNDQQQKNSFDFGDFFHLDSIAIEHEGFNVISSQEFLHRFAATGKLKSVQNGKPFIWNEKSTNVQTYLRSVGVNPFWDPMKCIAAIPSRRGPEAVEELVKAHHDMMTEKDGRPRPSLEEFEGKPVPVDAPMEERMRELLADREELCIYDEKLQNAPVIHFPAQKGTRLLTHFYAFIFFAEWKQDLWSKRFVRDHLRYIDEIMCASARVVQAVRRISKSGNFDSLHVRRGDFQYKKTRLEAKELIAKSKDKLEQGGLVYIATDERDKSFFDPFKEHYQIVFLDDFKELLTGINTNYYGMLDQLVASKGRVFFGTWWSTLSGYVNRMRGYYIAKHKLEGYEDGTMESYYFYPEERMDQMKKYMPVKKPIYMREFPASWRDIDKGIEELHQF